MKKTLIKVELRKNEYYVNGKIVYDMLAFSREEREALSKFKKEREDGKKIISGYY